MPGEDFRASRDGSYVAVQDAGPKEHLVVGAAILGEGEAITGGRRDVGAGFCREDLGQGGGAYVGEGYLG